MKRVVLALLIANVIVAGGFLLTDFSTSADEDAARQQINAESIRVLATGSQAAAQPRTKSAEEGQEASLSCAAWGAFPEGQVMAAEAKLSSFELGARLSRGEGGASSYLVLILPIQRRADVNRRVEELNRSGVTDQFIINDGEFRSGISLGYFKTEEAANRHLNSLKAKGVIDAVVRPRLSGSRTVTFLIRDLTNAERARLESMARDFPAVELRMQTCPVAGSAG